MMMNIEGASTPIAADHPLKKAWDAYTATDDFANTNKWAQAVKLPMPVEHPHLQGSLWAVFMAGFEAGAKSVGEHVKSEASQP